MPFNVAKTGEIDPVSDISANIPIEHLKVHDGDFYTVTDIDEDIDAAKYWHIKTPNTAKRAHIITAIFSDTAGVVELFIDPTLNTDGDALTAPNNDDNSSNESVFSFFKDPDVGADGTRLFVGRLGTEKPTSRIGGDLRVAAERIAKQNSSYLIKYTPDAANAKGTFLCEFYEV